MCNDLYVNYLFGDWRNIADEHFLTNNFGLIILISEQFGIFQCSICVPVSMRPKNDKRFELIRLDKQKIVGDLCCN